MKTRFVITSAACVLLSILKSADAQQKKYGADVEAAMQTASADEIKASITYLADDKLLGRQPGKPGFRMAVDYVVEQLKQYGVKPAGEDGTWLQTVRLRRASTVKNPQTLLTIYTAPDAMILDSIKKDITILTNPKVPEVTVKGTLAFAGYGISEPKLNYDDYAGLDVKGKIVLITRGAPDQFSSSVRSHVMNATTLLKTAAEHGAIGVIIGTADSTARFFAGGDGGGYSILDDKGNVVVSRSFYSEQVKMLANLDYKVFNQLISQAGKNVPAVIASIKSGKPASFPLSASIAANYRSVYQDIISYNVVGKIEGSDKNLKSEYVVHSAHLDHLGVGRPVQGDSIYNGAHDNASGVASLLQIAKIYHNIKVKPKRSILIVMVTGEELGDLGSGYFASHPTVPVKSMVADVNTDMPTIIAPLLSVTALGAEHSSLSKTVDEASAYLGLTVEPDPEPDQNRFVRSDQYSFVVHGIPALHIKYGSRTPDGKNNLNDFVKVWRAKYYHKPQDDINGIFDFDAGRKYAQLNFLIGYIVANMPERPTWNKGDIFSGSTSSP